MAPVAGGGGPRRKIDPEKGRILLSEPQKYFLEWLVDPEKKGHQHQADVAAHLGIAAGTLGKWKRDPAFRRAWEERCGELNISPDRLQIVIDAMHNKAAKGDVQAAKLYLEYVNRLAPPVQRISVEPQAQQMSDEELAAATEASIHALRAVGD